MKDKRKFILLILITLSILLIFTGLSYYLTLDNKNQIKEIASVESNDTVVNLTKDDTAYQAIYPEYEVAYVYILSTFSKQLDSLENSGTSNDKLHNIVNDFQELVNDFVEQVPDSPTAFQISRDFAVSSALETKTALNEYEQLLRESKLSSLVDKKSRLNDAVKDFKKSQKNYVAVMETLN